MNEKEIRRMKIAEADTMLRDALRDSNHQMQEVLRRRIERLEREESAGG